MRLTVFFCAFAALAQAQTPKAFAGLEPTWDVAVVLQEIGTHAGRLLPALNQLDAKAWVAKGASDTYVEQLETTRQQTQAVAVEAQTLLRSPEKLSVALQLFFRMQSLETLIGSLQQGAAKYQSLQVAQSIASVFAEGGPNRERLRAYIVNLASEREHQFEVMDREAQRCRASLMATPPPQPCPTPSTRKK
ncbi:MAG: hypothetical protein ABI759_07260 [Candidatus Solibacter sp.]